MPWWQAVILGALQGVTEFLPVSSSGHLVIFQHFFEFQEDHGAQAIFFDGVLHFGTTVAVLFYFRADLQRFLSHFGRKIKSELPAAGATEAPAPEAAPWPRTAGEFLWLGVLMGLATVPAVVVSLWKAEHIQKSFNQPVPVAINFLILGCILIATDRLASGQTRGRDMRWWQALLIGTAQAGSAVFRGLSRSGMTISMSLLAGLERGWAVRFSFMMSVIASSGLGLLGILRALKDPLRDQWMTPSFLWMTLLGVVVSGVVGYLTIHPLIRLVRQARLSWFALYLVLISLTVMIWA